MLWTLALPDNTMEAAHRPGLPVHVWTVDDAATMSELLALCERLQPGQEVARELLQVVEGWTLRGEPSNDESRQRRKQAGA